jgi:hypothetical protein
MIPIHRRGYSSAVIGIRSPPYPGRRRETLGIVNAEFPVPEFPQAERILCGPLWPLRRVMT